MFIKSPLFALRNATTQRFSFRAISTSSFKSAKFALIGAALSTSPIAFGTTIFEDNFDRPSSTVVGPGWLESEASSNDVAIYNNELRLRGYQSNQDTYALFELDTSDWQDITVSFDLRILSSTEASDSLVFGLADQTNNLIDTLFSTDLGTAGSTSTSFALPTAFDDAGSMTFGFWLFANSHTETVYVDNLVISGTQLATPQPDSNSTAVSEASSLALLTLGLAGLFAQRKRRVIRLEN